MSPQQRATGLFLEHHRGAAVGLSAAVVNLMLAIRHRGAARMAVDAGHFTQGDFQPRTHPAQARKQRIDPGPVDPRTGGGGDQAELR